MCDKRRQSVLEEGSLVMGVHLPPLGERKWHLPSGLLPTDAAALRDVTPMIFDFVLDTVTIMKKKK